MTRPEQRTYPYEGLLQLLKSLVGQINWYHEHETEEDDPIELLQILFSQKDFLREVQETAHTSLQNPIWEGPIIEVDSTDLSSIIQKIDSLGIFSVRPQLLPDWKKLPSTEIQGQKVSFALFRPLQRVSIKALREAFAQSPWTPATMEQGFLFVNHFPHAFNNALAKGRPFRDALVFPGSIKEVETRLTSFATETYTQTQYQLPGFGTFQRKLSFFLREVTENTLLQTQEFYILCVKEYPFFHTKNP